MYHLTIAAIFAFLHTTSICDANPSSLLVEMPQKCKGKNYCTTKHKDYPQEIVDSLLQDVGDMFEEGERKHIHSNNKSDNTPNECQTRISIRPIYEIIDGEGNVRFVVQSTKFRQFVRIEECAKPGRILESTLNIPNFLLHNFKLYCVPIHMEFKFVVLSLDQTSMETVSVKGGVPVCCSCQRKE